MRGRQLKSLYTMQESVRFPLERVYFHILCKDVNINMSMVSPGEDASSVVSELMIVSHMLTHKGTMT